MVHRKNSPQTERKQEKRKYTSMPRAEFKPGSPIFKRPTTDNIPRSVLVVWLNQGDWCGRSDWHKRGNRDLDCWKIILKWELAVFNRIRTEVNGRILWLWSPLKSVLPV